MAGCLQDHAWRISYGPADDRLREFYIPALSRSVLYERTAGFFSSTALAVAAAGVAHLVRSGGRMRLLVGAELSEDDVRAIERGEEAFGKALEHRLLQALEELASNPSDPKRRRLEVLAWLVAEGRLEIRVVLPLGPGGRPLPAARAADYFHPKEGLFTDACGHQIAFSGSVNESAQGWERNYEQFMVYRSWDSSRPYLLQVAERIRRLFEGQEEGWMALPIPEAVRLRLLSFAPERPPEMDPLELPPRPRAIPADQRERIIFQFLRDAPKLPGGELVGLRTAGVSPWPHQARIAREVVRRFPERFLLADEVGLGKTIEAGLIIRSLLLSGKVRRCLILVPKGVLRQWQEELYEKFGLNVPAYDGKGFHDYFRQVPTPPGNPWDAYPLLLASCQLAKRVERREALLQAGPFDLVVLDEAHHARRREFLNRRYRPNRLLSLLEGEDGRPGLRFRTRGLLLLTATPMQVHPVEVYDLLRQLDLPPAWAASEMRFLRFLSELRKARAEENADWTFLLRMTQSSLDGRSLKDLIPGAEDQVGVAEWERINDLLRGRRSPREVWNLSPPGKAVLLEACRRASPLGVKMFRTTRALLRRYHQQGLLADPVPERDPKPVWIKMSEDEWALYSQVERYVSEAYQRLEGERKGLGFIMTVYRRRLTSSFAALRRSLERRRAFLLGQAGPLLGLTDEDLEDDDLDTDIAEELESALRESRLPPALQNEVAEIDRLLAEIDRLPEDSKFQQLVADLRELLSQRETVAVFTHYTDTMDDLRDRLVGLYGRRLACYSGRGGERYDGTKWVKVSKEEVKNAFREGEIQVLLCTEAASEGLNLQTCGVLINYDMPWNPMRVEQRIGRFDRIGQRYPEVWIRHYFVVGPQGEDTVESKVYRALEDRIDWFRSVVGELQPILAGAARAIERAALATGDERERILSEELKRIREEVEAQQAMPLSLDEWVGLPEGPDDGKPPLTLADLERTILASSLRERFTPHRTLTGAYRLDLAGSFWDVTFDPAVADAHPGRVRLLTYGEELLDHLLETVKPPISTDEGTGVIRASARGFARWFKPEADGSVREVEDLSHLERVLQEMPLVRPEHVVRAREKAEAELRMTIESLEQIDRQRASRDREMLRERGQLILAEATACEAALSGATDLETCALRLMGSGYPWAPLGKLVGYPETSEVAAFLEQIASEAQARRKLQELREQAKEVVSALAKPPTASPKPADEAPGQLEVQVFPIEPVSGSARSRLCQ